MQTIELAEPVIKESYSYRFFVENISTEKQNVILFDIKKRTKPNFGNPMEVNVQFAMSQAISCYSYMQFLADVTGKPVTIKSVGAYVNKEPVSILLYRSSESGTVYTSPISKGFIYPNEKTSLDVSFELGQELESYLIVDSMPPMSKLWIELFPEITT